MGNGGKYLVLRYLRLHWCGDWMATAMSASEKLKALEHEQMLEGRYPDLPDGQERIILAALPQIVAVVEAAEATPYYSCKVCGFSPTNRASWCDLGCGRDYNEMLRVPLPALAALEEALS